MIIVFTKANTISSTLIRAITWGKWSHVAMVNASNVESITPDTTIIDSTFLHGGVRERTIKELLEPMSEWAYVEVDIPREDAAWDAARRQLGKGYDVLALIGILFHIGSWAEDDVWFCNELFEYVSMCGGNQRFRVDISRLTPEHCWMVNTKHAPIFRSKKDGHSY